LINVKVTIQEFTVHLVSLWGSPRVAFEMKKRAVISRALLV